MLGQGQITQSVVVTPERPLDPNPRSMEYSIVASLGNQIQPNWVISLPYYQQKTKTNIKIWPSLWLRKRKGDDFTSYLSILSDGNSVTTLRDHHNSYEGSVVVVMAYSLQANIVTLCLRLCALTTLAQNGIMNEVISGATGLLPSIDHTHLHLH